MELRFYEVTADVASFRSFAVDPTVAYDAEADHLALDGSPKARVWTPPPVVVAQPELPEGDFSGLDLAGGGGFAVRPETLDRTNVEYYLASAGELLPLEHDGRIFRVLNVLECLDALDRDRTDWEERDGDRHVAAPVFRADRLGWQLFKVLETAVERIYCWEDSDNAYDQFKCFVERERLTGLRFVELYSTEA